MNDNPNIAGVMYQSSRESRPSLCKSANRPSQLMNDSKFSERVSDSLLMKRSIYQCKVILLGDIAVGKTSILSRFVDNKYQGEYRCSVGVEFKVRSLFLDETTGADLKIWDTCGEERFRTITRQYYRDTNGIILIFDLTNKNSFMKLPSWIDDIKDYGPRGVNVILIGNKSDLTESREVSFSDATAFSNQHNISYIEVSAKTGNNVLLLFENLTRMMVKREQDMEKKKKNKENLDTSEISNRENGMILRASMKIEEKKGCCK